MFSHAEMAMGRPYDLPYSVELWDHTDSHVEELIALTTDYRVARGAYEEGREATARADRDIETEDAIARG
jgi:hypothetical protein